MGGGAVSGTLHCVLQEFSFQLNKPLNLHGLKLLALVCNFSPLGLSFVFPSRICTIQGGEADTGWNSSHLLLPPGEFVLVWDALLDEPKRSHVLIDNITLLHENCTGFDTPGQPISILQRKKTVCLGRKSKVSAWRKIRRTLARPKNLEFIPGSR